MIKEKFKNFIASLLPKQGISAIYERPRKIKKIISPEDVQKAVATFLSGNPEIAEKLFNRIELDEHVEGVKSARISATVGLNLKFASKKESDAASHQIKFLNQQFENIETDSLLEDILEAKFRMFKVIEPHWANEGQLTLKGHTAWENDLFKIDRRDIYINANGKKQAFANTPQDCYRAVKVRSRKAIYLHCIEPYIIKNFGYKSWAHFIEVFSDPFRIGYYPDGARKEIRDQVWEAVLNLGQDGAAAFPMSAKYELVENSRTGDDTFRGIVEKCEAGLSKAIIGHSAGADSTPGKLGNEQTAINVRSDLVKADHTFALRWIKRGFVTPLLQFNFSAPESIYPILTESEIITREEIRKSLRLLWEMGGEIDPIQFESMGVNVQKNAQRLKRKANDFVL